MHIYMAYIITKCNKMFNTISTKGDIPYVLNIRHE